MLKINLGNLKIIEEVDIVFLDSNGNQRTLFINDCQAMQAWEKDIMHRSADILCEKGGYFLEAGLGFGYSAIRIAESVNTIKHTVVEKYQKVIDIFKKEIIPLPTNLEIIEDDIFEYIYKVAPASYDGIFFDPALSMATWDNSLFWDKQVPAFKKILKPGGRFVPFFSTNPLIRKQFCGHFEKIIIEKYPFKSYVDTSYTYTNDGFAYIQCFINDDP